MKLNDWCLIYMQEPRVNEEDPDVRIFTGMDITEKTPRMRDLFHLEDYEVSAVLHNQTHVWLRPRNKGTTQMKNKYKCSIDMDEAEVDLDDFVDIEAVTPEMAADQCANDNWDEDDADRMQVFVYDVEKKKLMLFNVTIKRSYEFTVNQLPDPTDVKILTEEEVEQRWYEAEGPE